MQTLWESIKDDPEPLTFQEGISLESIQDDVSVLNPRQYLLLSGDVPSRELLQGIVRAVEPRPNRKGGRVHVTLATGEDRVVDPTAIVRCIKIEAKPKEETAPKGKN